MNNKSVFGYARRNLYPDGERFVFDGGLTLRDYFAAMAMQTIIHKENQHTEIAKEAYQIADAMLEERSK